MPTRLLLLGALTTLAFSGPHATAVAGGPEGGLDSRAWEMVSPVDKGGGEVGPPAGAAPGAFQAAAAGGDFTFGSSYSFGWAEGAPPVSQYHSVRGPGGWATENLSPALLTGTYGGGAYQLFASDLSRGLLSNGWRCRDGGSDCAAENPPLAGDALAGYRTLYLRDGGYGSLLTPANSPALIVTPEDFTLSLEGATPDLRHAVISTCAALTADAVGVSGPSGCDPASANLYRWSDEGALTPVNLLPGESATEPGAALASPSGAISVDGSRVYWTHGGDLYLRDGAATRLVAVDSTFQAASASGAVAFFTQAGHLFRFQAATGTSEDLAPAGGVHGSLGAAADGSRVYFLATTGLYLWSGGSPLNIAATADPSSLPAATGTARVSADGTRLAFLSSISLTGYPNAGHAQVYLYESPDHRLTCVSCNPKGAAPLGPSTIPPARAAGEGPPAYKPRVLSADGRRLFFDSADALVAPDTDSAADVYEWEAQGAGSCTSSGGCLALISNGRTGADSFLDASADGTDVFFLTPAPLDPADSEGLDVYDARAGGGFPEPPPPAPCEGDDCQGPALPPTDPMPGTLVETPGNPPVRFAGSHPACRKGLVRKRGRCVPKPQKQSHRAKRGGRS